MLLIDITTSAMTGARAPRGAELQPAWDISDDANKGDLNAPIYVPTGGARASDWPAIQGASAMRVVFGEHLREGAL